MPDNQTHSTVIPLYAKQDSVGHGVYDFLSRILFSFPFFFWLWHLKPTLFKKCVSEQDTKNNKHSPSIAAIFVSSIIYDCLFFLGKHIHKSDICKCKARLLYLHFASILWD